MTREEAIRILDEVIPPPEHHTVDLDHLRIAQAWLCIKETLTAEPIVRCRDCKYSVFEQWTDALDIYTCNRTSLTRACGYCSPTDFCSWGERKEEGEE